MGAGPCNQGEWESDASWQARKTRDCPPAVKARIERERDAWVAQYHAQRRANGSDIAGLEGYLAELGAEARLGVSTLAPGAAHVITPVTLSLQVADLLRSSLTTSDIGMWELDRTWAPTATFFSAAQCVRVAEVGGGWRTERPYVQGNCRNWAGGHVPPSCTWAQWQLAGCDVRTLLDGMFQYPRYVWAQKKMAELIEQRPSDPSLLADWVIEAHTLESVLAYSSNIRFDDDGAYDIAFMTIAPGNFGGYKKWLTQRKVLFAASAPVVPSDGEYRPEGPGTRFYNYMGVRRAMDLNEEQARWVPRSREDFAPYRTAAEREALREWARLTSGQGALIQTGEVVDRRPRRGVLRVLAQGFDDIAYQADAMLRHYLAVPFTAWQREALAYYLLGIEAIVRGLPPDGRLSTEILRADVRRAADAVHRLPEAQLRQSNIDMAANFQAAGGMYIGLLSSLISVVNSVAGLVFSLMMQGLDWIARGLVDAAGAAQGRPALCPAPPYIRMFADRNCALGTEVEIARALDAELYRNRLRDSALLRDLSRNVVPLDVREVLRTPALSPPLSPKTDKGGGGILVGAAALLLLSRFLR